MRRYSKSDLALLSADLAAPLPPPKPKKRNLESEMQRALIRWWQTACRDFSVPELCLFSIPNGFNGDARRGSVMKAEGQRKGVPDLFLAHPKEDRYYGVWRGGLFLELKTPTGRLSPEQEVYHEILRKQSYQVEVCHTFDDAVKTITEYLT